MSISASDVSRVTGVGVEYVNFSAGKTAMLPQRAFVIAVGSHGVDYKAGRYTVNSAASEIGEIAGYGSVAHLAALQFFPLAGKCATFPVTFYLLEEDEDAVQATGTITVSGAATANGTIKVNIGGQKATVAIVKGDAISVISGKIKNAIDAILSMPVTVTVSGDNSETVTLSSKSYGAVGNLIKTKVEGSVDGVVFAVTQLSGGAKDPDITPALQSVGEIWETMILPCFDYKDTDRLDLCYDFGENRWSELIKKPCLFAWGSTDTAAVRTAVTDVRKQDKYNFLVSGVGSMALPFEIACRAMICDILTTADSNPACGYKGKISGIEAGSDEDQESYNTRNDCVMKGSSTSIKNGNLIELNDIVTMYHPDNEGKQPAYRYVVNVIKLMNIVYNVRLIMEAEQKKGSPLVNDEEVVSNPKAIQPKMVKSELMNLYESLSKNALIQDAKTTAKMMTVAIDSENPNKLNVKFPVKLSGNIEIVDAVIPFGFYYGGE